MLSRHIHPSWVTGMVLKGAWRYLEHDWVAEEGSFVYEPPGEIHTLVVDEQVGAQEMITFFNIHGAMVYVDEAGKVTGYEDVFTKIEMCRKHYVEVGLGEGSSTSSCARRSPGLPPPGEMPHDARRCRAHPPPKPSPSCSSSPSCGEPTGRCSRWR